MHQFNDIFENKFGYVNIFGSGALSGKMLLVRILENNKVNAYFKAGKVK